MRILIYGINFYPELTGIGKYTGEMAFWLAAQGHVVEIITSPPYYPEWQVHRDYKGKYWRTEKVNGVKVYRCPMYVPENVTSLKRIIHEFSFVLSSFPIWLKKIFQKKADLTFVIAPPFHLGVLPVLYSKIKKSVLITHIQDLQVDAAKELGMINNKSFLNMMFGLEKWILKNCTKVSTISSGMKKKILLKGIEEKDLIQFPNWVDQHTIKPLAKSESLREDLQIGRDEKVVLYSGNLGEKQGLEVIINVADHLSPIKELTFVICGTGGAKDKLVSMVAQRKIKNITFIPLQPYEKLSELLAIADLHLVLQKKSASDLVMPSKLTGILSAGGCSIVTALPGTSLYEVIAEHQMGILVEPENEQALAQAIEKALDSDVKILKRNARNYSVNYLSKNEILKRFEEDISSIVEQH